MAEWNKNKVEPSVINKGQEFKIKDNLAIEELNAIVNNSFYASDKAKRAEELAESAVKGNGTIVTIDGQIQGEWSADFAESERQKSKNLFDYTKIKSLSNGITQADATFTINTQFYFPEIDYDINLNQGKTYTFSLNIDSYSNSDGSSVRSEIVLFDANGNTDTKGTGNVSNTGRYLITFTPEFDVVSVQIRPIRKGNNTSTLTGTASNLMLCVGKDIDYQPYNGTIVHEKDVQILSQQKEDLSNKTYTMTDFNENISSNKYPNNNVLSDAIKGIDTFHNRVFESEDEFFDWVKNIAPTGSYVKFIQIQGAQSTMIIQKTSSAYSAIIQFGYSGFIRYKALVAGEWGNWASVTLS